MAQAILVETALRLNFEVGVNEKGEPVYKTKNFTNVKREATADQLHQAALAISALCKDPLSNVERNDSSEIMA